MTSYRYRGMPGLMRTTVRLNDALWERARREAAARGQTLTALIEQGLQLALAQSRPAARRRKVKLPVSRECGGLLPGIDLSNSASLLELLEDGLPLEKRR